MWKMVGTSWASVRNFGKTLGKPRERRNRAALPAETPESGLEGGRGCLVQFKGSCLAQKRLMAMLLAGSRSAGALSSRFVPARIRDTISPYSPVASKKTAIAATLRK